MSIPPSGRLNESNWLIFILASTVLSFGVISTTLSFGIDVFFSHLLYIPVILTAYHFTRRGILFSLAIAVLYVADVAVLASPDLSLLIITLGRGAMFILIAAVVVFLSTRLRERELRYHGTFDYSEAGMCLIGEPDLIILEANRQCARIAGYPYGEANGTPVAKFWTDAPARERFFAELRRNGTVRGFETSISDSGGSPLWLLLSGGVLDQHTYIVAMVDITDRKRTTEEIRAANKRYVEILDSMPDAIHVIDRDMRIVLFNRVFQRWCRDLGISHLAGAIGRRFDEVFPFLPPSVGEEYRQVFSTGRPLETEERTQIQERQVVTHTTKIPVSENGTVERIVTVIRDITSLKDAEASIRESEERYRAVVEDQTELISRFLPDGTQVFVNDAYCRYVGKTRDEIIGTRFKPCIPTEDRVRLDALLSSLTPESSTGVIEHRIIMPDTTVRWQQWIDRGFFDEQGTLREIQSVGRDITATKDAEEAHRRSEDLYRTVFETTGSATMILNEDGTIWRANSEFSSRFGFFSEDLEGKPALDLFEEEERGRLRLYHRDRRGSGPFPPRSYETWIIDQQGMRRDVMLTVDMIPETRQSVVSILDLTAQKQAERLITVANAINQLIVHERNVTDLLISACDEFGRLNRYFVVSIALKHGEILRPVAISDERFTGMHFSGFESRLFSDAVESGNVMFETFSEEDGMHPFNALLIVPMAVENDVKGILSFYMYPQALMHDQDIASMKTLAEDLAFAIKAIAIETEKRLALEQIERNIEQMAVLNDHIRNPLQAIVGLADIEGGDLADKIFGQAQEIDRIIHRLDIGWVESTKIREFLVKHYGMGK
ncbi:MAG: hypothetical protein APR53_08285 [Methanoculleus sp. SDB]|nr:MAG: hypothetical protein APR53_08285 [Methanoculleus sp. SDB]